MLQGVGAAAGLGHVSPGGVGEGVLRDAVEGGGGEAGDGGGDVELGAEGGGG